MTSRRRRVRSGRAASATSRQVASPSRTSARRASRGRRTDVWPARADTPTPRVDRRCGCAAAAGSRTTASPWDVCAPPTSRMLAHPVEHVAVRRRQHAGPRAVGEDDGGGGVLVGNRLDDRRPAPPWSRRPRRATPVAAVATEPSTEMTAGGRTSSTSRRPPSRRRRQRRVVSPAGSATCEQPERLRRAEFVGEERGHRPGAPIEREVTAHDEVATRRPPRPVRWRRAGCRVAVEPSIRTARAAPVASALRSASSAAGGPRQTHRHRSSTIRAQPERGLERGLVGRRDAGPPRCRTTMVRQGRRSTPTSSRRRFSSAPRSSVRAHECAKTTPWPPSGYVQVIAPSLLHTR